MKRRHPGESYDTFLKRLTDEVADAEHSGRNEL
jgi:hypothetical protein